MIKYFAQPLWEFRPSEFADEFEQIVEFEIDRDGTPVTVVAPKDYELNDKDYARIEELTHEV
jgi:hypothetical protein